MVFFMVILTVILFVIFEIIFKLRTKVMMASSPLKPQTFQPPENIKRYFHQGHSWALVHNSPTVLVGIDDFTQCFIGRIERIELPPSGSLLQQGDPLITVHHKGKSLTLVAPISGTVAEINHKLKQCPNLINDFPYEKGWLMKIAPLKLSIDLRNLLIGVIAEKWEEIVRLHLVHRFTPKLGTVLQDGGQLIWNFSDQLDDHDWLELAQELYPMTVPLEQSNLKPLI